MHKGIIIFIGVVMMACTPKPTAQEVVDAAINAAGLTSIHSSKGSFDFRDKSYEFRRQDGLFIYSRIQSDSTGAIIRDVYSNNGLERFINDTIAEISDEKRSAYANSVNSVIYFAFLPLWLNDEAVNKLYVGEELINGKAFHKVSVTFQQEGGGKDFEDVFLYWFDKEDYSTDFIAYSYITDGGGVRFREAYNARKVNGVIVQDYRNYKPKDKNSDLMEIGKAFDAGELELLSTIDLKNVEISSSMNE
ncbi:MAG: hypothetical protein JXQ90_05565 [Cyclobacteriaceae bacterium]